MKYRLVWFLLPAFLGAALVACSNGDSIDPTASGPTGDVIDREVLLGNVEDVRAIIAENAETLDPAMVDDVEYSDGRLRVVLADAESNLDVSGLEAACEEISNAIALPDMTVMVEKADGSESIECEFTG